MPAYAYTGLNARGKQTKGVTSADNVAALKAALRREGVFLTSVTETLLKPGAEQGASGEVDLSRFLDRVTPEMVAQMTRLMGTLLHAGVTLPEALRALTEQVESHRFKGILNDVAEKVNEGSALADAMAQYPGSFPNLYVNMIRAGEASGSLEVVLFRLAEFMEKQLEIRGKVVSAMFYPLVLGVLGMGMIVFLMIGVVPKLTGMFADMDAKLPWNTELLIWMSKVVTGYWILVLIAVAGGVWGFRRWRATAAGQRLGDAILLRIPVAGDLVRKVAISRFARTLSTLLASGVQLLQALDIVRTLLGNAVLEEVLTEARDNIREGQGIAPALKESGQFPPLVTHMVGVGERSGQLEQMLTDVANAYDRETDTTIGRLTSLLEPLMIVVMGGAVAFVVFSIMRPIMMLTEMAG